jgi:hypothetical protein
MQMLVQTPACIHVGCTNKRVNPALRVADGFQAVLKLGNCASCHLLAVHVQRCSEQFKMLVTDSTSEFDRNQNNSCLRSLT